MSLGLALVVALNQQVVSGQALAAPHYHWYFVKPLAIAFIVLLAWIWIEDMTERQNVRLRRLVSAAWIGLTIFFITFGILYQYTSYRVVRSFWIDAQKYGPALKYLDAQARASDTVYARDVIRNFVAIYTPANVYWATDAHMYLSSDQRARDEYFFDLWVDGVSADQAAAEFPAARRAELSSRVHAIYYRETTGDLRNLPDAEVSGAVSAYRDYLSRSDEERLRAYPLDFAVLKKDLPETPAVSALKSRGELVYRDETYEIYSMK